MNGPVLSFLKTFVFPALAMALASAAVAQSPVPLSAQFTPSKASAAAAYSKLPMSFEPNLGQADPSIQYLAHGQGYTLQLRPAQAFLTLQDNSASKLSGVVMNLLGANAQATSTAEEAQITRTDYLIGNDPKLWHTSIPNYGRVSYHSVYKGIDIVYYGNQRQLEYDFVVAPYANPALIRVQFAGADELKLTPSGSLVIATGGSSVSFERPVLYQEIEGRRTPVDGAFRLAANHTVAFRLGSYNHALPLVIDPKIVYSTYYGSLTTAAINAIALDSADNLYIAGSCGPGLALESPYQSTTKTATGFVSEINAAATAVVYATYFGGSGGDSVSAIALDASANIYIAGNTGSTDFPTKNPLTSPSPVNQGSGFVAELAAGGQSLIYSTKIGGAGSPDSVNALAIDTAGNAYIAGNTYNTNFPVVNPIQSTNNISVGYYASTGFVAEIKAGGGSLVYSTYLGGSGVNDYYGDYFVGDSVSAIAVDPSGNTYVTGTTGSHDFPTVNAIQSQNKNNTGGYTDFPYTGDNYGEPTTTGFVAKIQPEGAALDFSTFLGGSGQCYDLLNSGPFDANISCSGDAPTSIALDAAGNAYVAGIAASYNFPLYKPYRSAGGAVSTGFISVLKADGSAFLYSTFFGGSGACLFLPDGEDFVQYQCGGDGISAIALDPSSNVYVTGYTASEDFPTLYPLPTQAYNVIADEGNIGNMPFVSSLKAGGQSLVYSTFLGGTPGQDTSRAIAVDAAGDAYIAGVAGSPNFPSYHSLQGINHGNNAFITEISLAKSAGPSPTFSPVAGTYDATQIVKISNTFPGTTYYTVDGTTPTNASTRYTGPITVHANEAIKASTYVTGYAPSNVASAAYVIKPPAAAPTFTPPAGSYAGTQSVKLSTTTPNPTIYYTLDGSAPSSSSARYTGPITVTASETIKAITYASLNSPSPVASAVYALNLPPAPAPTFSVKAGTYSSAQTVKLTDSNPHATIYYTTDNSTPTTSSKVYSSPITVSSTTTIKAVVHVPEYSLSPVASATYTIP